MDLDLIGQPFNLMKIPSGRESVAAENPGGGRNSFGHQGIGTIGPDDHLSAEILQGAAVFRLDTKNFAAGINQIHAFTIFQYLNIGKAPDMLPQQEIKLSPGKDQSMFISSFKVGEGSPDPLARWREKIDPLDPPGVSGHHVLKNSQAIQYLQGWRTDAISTNFVARELRFIH